MRFFSSNNDDCIDSISFDYDLYSNTNYFFEIIKKTSSDDFLVKEYRIGNSFWQVNLSIVEGPRPEKNAFSSNEDIVFDQFK